MSKIKLPLILIRITVGELATQNKDKEGLKWVLIPAKKRHRQNNNMLGLEKESMGDSD